jgi:hypothetical protein
LAQCFLRAILFKAGTTIQQPMLLCGFLHVRIVAQVGSQARRW